MMSIAVEVCGLVAMMEATASALDSVSVIAWPGFPVFTACID